jgi:spore coat protein CotH
MISLIRSSFLRSRFRGGIAALLLASGLTLAGQAAEVRLLAARSAPAIQVIGSPDNDWHIEGSSDLVTWTNLSALDTLLGGDETNAPSRLLETPAEPFRYYRARKTDGLYDTNLLRTVNLTFTQSNWASLLTTARSTEGNVLGMLTLDNGATNTGVGARYKGNSSFTMGGTKKSLNVTVNYTNLTGRLLGYETFNLNNAAGDETIMRESVYFTVMSRYVACPQSTMAQLYINGANWGVYSLTQNGDGDLIKQWFSSNDGDRWRAPNAAGGGGGGGFSSALSALSWQGTNVSSYKSNYELKHTQDTNAAWSRLVHAIDVLNNTPAADLRDKAEDVLAVDRWLWFLALEILFVDDDSYWNKGADYQFYFEPESGLMNPVEHDGNEAFTTATGIDYKLSPVVGASATGGSATLANRPLLYRLLPINELRQRYLAHLRTALEESFQPDRLTPLINHFSALSLAAITVDPKKSYTMTTYNSDLTALKTFVTNRYKFLTNHAELLPRPPSITAVYNPSVKPGPADVPTITAQVKGAGTDGIDSVWLYWRDQTYGRFSVRQMFDDGQHGDGLAGDGLYGGTTTNFAAGAKIHYYVEARSGNATRTAAFSPARAEQDTYSYRVGLASAPATPVVINELMAANTRTLADPQGQFDDWIELRNTTSAEIDLTGHHLSDEPKNPRKWAFPAGTKIPAGGYLLVWADEDGTATPGLHASFKLSASGETVFLTDTDANLNAVLDVVTFPALGSDEAYGRPAADSSVFKVIAPTPGTSNP